MTIREIARICGVSRGTVDRVVNRRGKVKPETEALLRDVLHNQGYTKNIVGRALTVKKSAPVVGAALSSVGNPFFDEVIRGLRAAEEELDDYGVRLELRQVRGYGVDDQLRLIDELAPQMSALVLQPINDPRIGRRIGELLESGVPTVTVNTDVENSRRVCYVGSDYYSGGETAAGMLRLVAGGRKSLGVVTGVDTLLGHVQRLDGFRRKLAEVCPGVRVVAMDSARDDSEHCYRITLGMLREHPEIDLLQVIAAGACDACRAVLELGREKDIVVTAFDDVPSTADMMRRGIIKAVVCQQPFLQGYRAFRAAFDAILADDLGAKPDVIVENQIKILENL